MKTTKYIVAGVVLIVVVAAGVWAALPTNKVDDETVLVEMVATEVEENTDLFDDEGDTLNVKIDRTVVPSLEANYSVVMDIAAAFDSELSDNIDYFDYMMFYKDLSSKQFCLKATKVYYQGGYNDCSQDSITITTAFCNWQIDNNNQLGFFLDNEAYLFSGLPAKEGPVTTAWDNHIRILPQNSLDFTLNRKKYQLQAEGIHLKKKMYVSQLGLERWENEDINYKLYLSDSSGRRQLIIAQPYFNSTFVSVLWVGDMDGDGLPDLLIDNSPEYEVKRMVLYLSTQAKNGQITGVAANFIYDFAC